MAKVNGEPLIERALELLTASGLACERWTVLSDGQRLVVELQPCNRVAKIAPADTAAVVERELALAGHIAARGGPVACPARSPSLVSGSALSISLWEPLRVLGAASPGPAYRALRPFMDSFLDPLPDFRETIRAARASLAGVVTLSASDVQLVASRFDALSARLSTFTWSERVLHGDPHAGNVLMTPSGARWLDFEAACRGPVEWALSALPADHGLEHRPELLEVLRDLRSACVVVWCSRRSKPNRAELEAVVCHLEQLRQSTLG